ncbi:fumarylacetoacetate hydrolase family protein [Nocardioides nematodiphilus]|uniref:fumarylacetoacetate hydrolase family protein n=1 Tax=Nocardioides nematodiphilus TaxID=2849669 RepID=UPI001CDA29F3|nr:fumarylacetoacetate hydrolase family protein [Nocardioides nematodiphilus]MCA1983251.1 fumarylacetoacetate hydrolase family protein [Nocardioides nematodiphilus]
MKIARFDEGRIGVVIGDEVVDVTDVVGIDTDEWPVVGPNRLIRDFASHRDAIEDALHSAPRHRLGEVTLRTPVPWASKVIAYPVNYHDHGREMQAGYRADIQGFFLKPSSSLSGAGEPVELPVVPGREVHHESELAIVIGKRCHNITREEWEEYVFGYACLLDMVVRGREERVFRKAFDTFCPVGPWITTADEVGDPTQLDMALWVRHADGTEELRQHTNTGNLVLDIPGMVQMAAAVMTLEPGDIIATGTPAGVGPVVDGDTIRITIERVGEMSVSVVQGASGQTEVFATPYTTDIAKQELVPADQQVAIEEGAK